MNRDASNLRLRVWRRDSPDRHRLVKLVLNIAQARHRAWLAGEPDPYGLPIPYGIERPVSCVIDGSAKFAAPSPTPEDHPESTT
ncbi:hypothetical protein [Acidipropionibacterium virtanenii]|uniref:Uncharacterized protein n=1 Tax=Acidipropionibacterium virtanenii TaxID=2057246 RepID=A0A344UV43_9ACTN|nr:hypothetical protein [Acidipropionibacterium virtanenii]AXE39141.1 hypothetical protein JS278_01985 [Acidipropionibacterium virtanenii]